MKTGAKEKKSEDLDVVCESMVHGNAARSAAWKLISEAGRGIAAKGWVMSAKSWPWGWVVDQRLSHRCGLADSPSVCHGAMAIDHAVCPT